MNKMQSHNKNFSLFLAQIFPSYTLLKFSKLKIQIQTIDINITNSKTCL